MWANLHLQQEGLESTQAKVSTSLVGSPHSSPAKLEH